MLTAMRGEQASAEIQNWANAIAAHVDAAVNVEVFYEGDSNTYVLRVVKGSRVLLFRLSDTQVHDPVREAECERTLKRKINDLLNLL